MRARSVSLVCALLVGCSDDGAQDLAATAGPTGSGPVGSGGDDGDDDGPGVGGSGSTGHGEAASDGLDGSGTATPDDGDTMGAVAGPVELYRGPVAGAIVPGWDPESPRPLLLLGRLGDTWVTTLARVGDDGSLSDNLAEEIIVWGWDAAPPQLHDGPVGSALAPWSADAPYPVVMLGRREADGAWWTTLSTIEADGTLGENLADRLVVWGWPGAELGAPALAYEGPIAGGVLPGFSADDPQPLVMLARFAGADTWQATLASIGPDGSLGDNVADEIRIWGW